MARGPLSAGGALLLRRHARRRCCARVGTSLDAVERGLDFGCSSGRTVRALHAAYPDAEWHGVDPNERRDRVGAGAPARRSSSPSRPQEPPLAFADGHFDFVVAISIWSHYGERAAIRWLDEMHRIIRPGGHLDLLHPRAAVRRLLRPDRPPLAGAARADPPRALPPRLLVRCRSSARRATGASSTTNGAPRSSRPSGSRASPLPRVDDRGLRRRPERRQPGHVRPAPPLTVKI